MAYMYPRGMENHASNTVSNYNAYRQFQSSGAETDLIFGSPQQSNNARSYMNSAYSQPQSSYSPSKSSSNSSSSSSNMFPSGMENRASNAVSGYNSYRDYTSSGQETKDIFGSSSSNTRQKAKSKAKAQKQKAPSRNQYIRSQYNTFAEMGKEAGASNKKIKQRWRTEGKAAASRAYDQGYGQM